MSFGAYPDVSLKMARDRRDAARRLLIEGIDPSEQRRQERAQASPEAFEPIAREWYAKQAPTWSTVHSGRVIRDLERDIFPWLGERSLNTIMAPELLEVLRRVEHRGAVETAHRELQVCGQVFRYAIALGCCARNPAADIRGALTTPRRGNFASIKEPKAVAALLRAIDE